MSTAASEEWTVVPARERKRAKPRVSDGCGRGKCSKNPNLQRQQETARAISASDPQGVGIERENVITARIADVLHPLIVHSRVYKHIIDLVHGETFESLMVLGVGRLTSDASVLQTALALALFRWMVARNPRAECAVCDPVLTPSDTSILIRLGLKVDDINRKGKISCSNKTLFFMPHCPYRLYSNVLWANWGQGLANVTILGNR